jgi:hypothetical protein
LTTSVDPSLAQEFENLLASAVQAAPPVRVRVSTDHSVYSPSGRVVYTVTGPPNTEVKWSTSVNDAETGEIDVGYGQHTDANGKLTITQFLSPTAPAGTWVRQVRLNNVIATVTFQVTGQVTSRTPGNLLVSGSFENGSAGWNTHVPAGATVNMVDYDTTAGAPAAAHDGDWYLAFNTDTLSGSVYQDVAVQAAAGTAFTATAWLSAQTGTATGWLCVWGLGPNTDDCVPYSVTAGSYSQVQVVYDAPASITGVRFEVYPAPGATTDMDTASISG